MRARSPLVVLALVGFGSSTARADGTGEPKSVQVDPVSSMAVSDPIVRRNHTIAEFELGFIALPNAPISPSERGGNLPIGTIGHGDATASLGMHLLYRGGVNWAIGAGALFCPTPTSNTTDVNGITVTHSRDYLWMGAEGRYIPIHSKAIEAWVGATVGGVIVADRFTTATAIQVPSDIGTSQVTVRTEGFSVGLQVGGDWAPTENLLVGLALRFDGWILPESEQCLPTGECATLTGPVAEVELGIRVGYRIPL